MKPEALTRLLLVDNNAEERRLRAFALANQGYEVDSIGTAAELEQDWDPAQYRLVLLSMDPGVRHEMGSWKRIQREHPAQEFMLLLSASEKLCSVSLDGVQIRDEESSDSFLQRLEVALSPR